MPLLFQLLSARESAPSVVALEPFFGSVRTAGIPGNVRPLILRGANVGYVRTQLHIERRAGRKPDDSRNLPTVQQSVQRTQSSPQPRQVPDEVRG